MLQTNQSSTLASGRGILDVNLAIWRLLEESTECIELFVFNESTARAVRTRGHVLGLMEAASASTLLTMFAEVSVRLCCRGSSLFSALLGDSSWLVGVSIDASRVAANR